MCSISSAKALIAQLERDPRASRKLGHIGIDSTPAELCDAFAAGGREERNRLTGQLLTVCGEDPFYELVLVAVYSCYITGRVAIAWHIVLSRDELWAIGLEALTRAVRSAARCGARTGFHIVRSFHRDYDRAVARYRRDPSNHGLTAPEVMAWEAEEVTRPFDDELNSATIEELVEWISSSLEVDRDQVRMVVATRLGGFGLGATNAERSRNCRRRRELEEQIRGSVSPAEGLAEVVLSRHAP